MDYQYNRDSKNPHVIVAVSGLTPYQIVDPDNEEHYAVNFRDGGRITKEDVEGSTPGYDSSQIDMIQSALVPKSSVETPETLITESEPEETEPENPHAGEWNFHEDFNSYSTWLDQRHDVHVEPTEHGAKAIVKDGRTTYLSEQAYQEAKNTYGQNAVYGGRWASESEISGDSGGSDNGVSGYDPGDSETIVASGTSSSPSSEEIEKRRDSGTSSDQTNDQEESSDPANDPDRGLVDGGSGGGSDQQQDPGGSTGPNDSGGILANRSKKEIAAGAVLAAFAAHTLSKQS